MAKLNEKSVRLLKKVSRGRYFVRFWLTQHRHMVQRHLERSQVTCESLTCDECSFNELLWLGALYGSVVERIHAKKKL